MLNIKKYLIDNWKIAYKYVSVQLTFLMGLLVTAYQYVPAIQSYFPSFWVQALCGLIIFARIVAQNKMDKQKECKDDVSGN